MRKKLKTTDTASDENSEMEAGLTRTINESLKKFNAWYKTIIPEIPIVIIAKDVTGALVGRFSCTSCPVVIKLYTRTTATGQLSWITSNFVKHLKNKHVTTEVSLSTNRTNRPDDLTTPRITSFFGKVVPSHIEFEDCIDITNCEVQILQTTDLDGDTANHTKFDDYELKGADNDDNVHTGDTSSGED